jgi:predicted DNA-binding transcriptional regulator AlpA
VDVDLLVDAREIAARLGFPRPQLVHYFVGADPTFPKPVWQGGPGRGGLRLWYWPEVDRWAARTGKARTTTE